MHTVYNVTEFLGKCAKQEIELNQKNEEACKKGQEIKLLMRKFEDMQGRMNLLSNENTQLVQKVLQHQDSYNLVVRNLVHEKKVCEQQSRKLSQLE